MMLWQQKKEYRSTIVDMYCDVKILFLSINLKNLSLNLSLSSVCVSVQNSSFYFQQDSIIISFDTHYLLTIYVYCTIVFFTLLLFFFPPSDSVEES